MYIKYINTYIYTNTLGLKCIQFGLVPEHKDTAAKGRRQRSYTKTKKCRENNKKLLHPTDCLFAILGCESICNANNFVGK